MLQKLYLKIFKYTSLIVLCAVSLCNLYYLTVMFAKVQSNSLVDPKQEYTTTFKLLIAIVIFDGLISSLTVSFELFLYQRTKNQRIFILLILSFIIIIRTVLGIVMLANSDNFFHQAENSHQLFKKFSVSYPLISQIHNSFCAEIVTLVMLPLFLCSLAYSQVAIMRKSQKIKLRQLEDQIKKNKKPSRLSFYSDSCNNINNNLNNQDL